MVFQLCWSSSLGPSVSFSILVHCCYSCCLSCPLFLSYSYCMSKWLTLFLLVLPPSVVFLQHYFFSSIPNRTVFVVGFWSSIFLECSSCGIFFLFLSGKSFFFQLGPKQSIFFQFFPSCSFLCSSNYTFVLA